MIIEVTQVAISKSDIRIKGTNLEQILLSDDLYQEFEPEEVEFVFDRTTEKAVGNMKYLYKVVESQKKTASARSMGEKLEKLVGCILSLSESFIEE